MTSAVRKAWKQLEGLDRENRYVAAAAELLASSGCTIRSWRSSLTGVAYTRSTEWAIEVPMPTTARAFGVFAHEVGHQVLHRGNSAPRWLEEVQAWEYALDRAEILLDRAAVEAIEDDAREGIAYAFGKALRRGLAVSVLYANDEARWWAQELDVREWGPDGRPRKEATTC